jgi:hypothetical protein
MLILLFLDMEGAVLVHFAPKGETADSQNYCEVLRMELKPTM